MDGGSLLTPGRDVTVSSVRGFSLGVSSYLGDPTLVPRFSWRGSVCSGQWVSNFVEEAAVVGSVCDGFSRCSAMPWNLPS